MTASLHRFAALVVLALLVALLLLGVVRPLAGAWISAGEAVQDARQLLARLQGVANGADRLEQLLAQRREEVERSPGAFEGASETLVAAQVQDRLKGAVDQAGGQLTSLRMLAPAQEGPFHRVALRAQIEATLPVLQRVLYALEGGHPSLILDNLTMRAMGGDDSDPRLSVQLDVIAFARIKVGGEAP